MNRILTLKEAGFDRASVMKAMMDNEEYSESEHPQIGIFWYDVDNDMLFGVNKEDAENMEFGMSSKGDRIKYYRKLHKSIWEKKRHQGRDKRFTGDYTLIPRGRVSQYEKDGFVVFVGDWIDEYPFVKDEIIEEFELPENTKFIKDTHWNIGHGWSEERI